MNVPAGMTSFEGDPPAASQATAMPDRKELALVAVERTRMPMVVTDPQQADNPIVLANHAFLELTGYSAEEVIGRNCRFLQGPGTNPADIDLIRRAIASSPEQIELELLNYRKDGSTFWNQLLINPVTNEAGELIYYFASQKDVTARRRAVEMEATERLLLMEVDHRAMNALALVQSIVGLSRAETAEDYAAAVRGRVESIALAHRLLAEAAWAGADLADLLLAQAPTPLRDRIHVNGAAVHLPAALVQPLALVLHELTSNAFRHGALARRQGCVEVECLRSEDCLQLKWCETGSEHVVDPRGTGVGLKLVEGIVRQQLRGTVSTSWHQHGLEIELLLPMEDQLVEAQAVSA